MARAQKLKVFRTPIGFHDAYVAAPSQKAALEAWGADSNLFAIGGAERIEVPELMREPLAKPGQVIRRPRGTLAEHVAALPKKTTVKTGKTERAKPAEVQRMRRPAKPKPLPSRAALDRAEAALVEVQQRQDAARAELTQRQAVLDRARQTLEAKQKRERSKLEERIAAARDKYDRSMRAWRAD